VNDKADLKDLIKQLPSKKTSAKVRELMPEIEAKLSEGVTHEDIVNVLKAQGINISLDVFRVYLYRHRKKTGGNKKTVLIDREKVNQDYGNIPDNEPNDLDAVLKNRDQTADKFLMQRKPLLKQRK